MIKPTLHYFDRFLCGLVAQLVVQHAVHGTSLHGTSRLHRHCRSSDSVSRPSCSVSYTPTYSRGPIEITIIDIQCPLPRYYTAVSNVQHGGNPVQVNSLPAVLPQPTVSGHGAYCGSNGVVTWTSYRPRYASCPSVSPSVPYLSLPSLRKCRRGCLPSPFDSVMHNSHCFLKLHVSCVHVFLYVLYPYFGCLPWFLQPITDQCITTTGSRSLPILETCPNHVNLGCAILSTNVLRMLHTVSFLILSRLDTRSSLLNQVTSAVRILLSSSFLHTDLNWKTKRDRKKKTKLEWRYIRRQE